MNGLKVADVIRRINLFLDDGNWLSLNSSNVKVIGRALNIYFGEVNKDNLRHGRGISIYPSGEIRIGYFDNHGGAPGNYLKI